MASRTWLTRERALIFLLLTVPRCTCNGCFSGDESCAPTTTSGCDFGTNNNNNNTCEVVPGTHTVSAQSSGFGACTLMCETGWFDCNGLASDGCEHDGPCPTFSDAAPTTSPTLLATLTGAPRGLAACGDLYFFDDDVLKVVHSGASATVLTSGGMPSGGIACDMSNVYWATLSSTTDGGVPSGGVWSVALGQTAPGQLATNVDPGRGIDVQGARVYWIARSGFGNTGSMLAYTTGGTSLALMPAVETDTYKAFALSYDGQYSLANGAVWFAAFDAGPVTLDVDASVASALFAGAGGTFAVFQGLPPVEIPDASTDANSDASDASDASPDDAALDDAGDAGLDAAVEASTVGDYVLPLNGAPMTGPFERIVATTASAAALVASDDTLYVIDLPSGTFQVLWYPALHVVDVAMDGTYAYWTTLGQGTVAGAVWKMALP